MSSVKYTIDPSDLTNIIVTPESIIDDILTVNPTYNNFMFPDGNYYITVVLHINRSNVKFISQNRDCTKVHIFQKTSTKDGVSIQNVSNVIIQYISVHVPFDQKITLTVASATMTKVENCHFYGNSTYFTVYYAGPSNLVAGEPTLHAYSIDNLDYGNVFRHNIIYSSWSGDSISFALQHRGLFTKNIVRGGKVAVYMCKSCYITSNLIYDSGSNGIFVSLPSHDLQIKYNKIYECKYSAIKIANQLEHGPFTATKYHMLIQDNYIYDAKMYSIEVNNALRLSIIDNKFIESGLFGIYCLNCDDVQIENNKMSYFTSGVYSQTSNNINVVNNQFYSVYPDIANNVVKFITSTNSSVTNNVVNGQISGTPVSISSDTTNVVNNANVFNTYYPYPEEYDITK